MNVATLKLVRVSVCVHGRVTHEHVYTREGVHGLEVCALMDRVTKTRMYGLDKMVH